MQYPIVYMGYFWRRNLAEFNGHQYFQLLPTEWVWPVYNIQHIHNTECRLFRFQAAVEVSPEPLPEGRTRNQL